MSAILAETVLHSVLAGTWGYFSTYGVELPYLDKIPYLGKYLAKIGSIPYFADKEYVAATAVVIMSTVSMGLATFRIADRFQRFRDGNIERTPTWKKMVYTATPPIMWSCGIALAVSHLFKGGTLSSHSNS